MSTSSSAVAAGVPAVHGSLARVLATTTVVQILATATGLALTAIVPSVAAGMGVGEYLIGYQISLIYAVGMVACAAAGMLIDWYGPVKIEQTALATFALGLLGLAGGHIALAVFGTMLIGVGYGLQNPASSHLLGAVTPRERRSVIFSIKQAGVPLGGVVASLMMPLLLGPVGWRGALLLLATGPALMAILIGRHPDGPPVGRAHDRSLLAIFRAEQALLWRSASLRSLSILGLFYSALQLSLSAFVVVMLLGEGWSLFAAGGIAATMQLCGAAGRVSWGVVADRTGSGLAVLALIGVVSAACALALPFQAAIGPVGTVLILCVFGFCITGWNGVHLAEVTHHCDPRDVGRVTGAVLVYTFLGVTLGPATFATLYSMSGSYPETFAALSLAAIVGSLLSWRAARATD